ncbi:glycerophosphoryl diester phosphodiesterase family domain-containing protein [Ditylenchus destructor]|nr:glycerophosphoryl diester phosphodiesterase family domain-containing protein [Ditylenchus destructor]
MIWILFSLLSVHFVTISCGGPGVNGVTNTKASTQPLSQPSTQSSVSEGELYTTVISMQPLPGTSIFKKIKKFGITIEPIVDEKNKPTRVDPVEVSAFGDDTEKHYKLHRQNPYGEKFNASSTETYLIFHIKSYGAPVTDFEVKLYKDSLFTECKDVSALSIKCKTPIETVKKQVFEFGKEEHPMTLGSKVMRIDAKRVLNITKVFGFNLPDKIKDSSWTPITRLVTLKVSYLLIKPRQNPKVRPVPEDQGILKKQIDHWKEKPGRECGHRGGGNTYLRERTDIIETDVLYRENTVETFISAIGRWKEHSSDVNACLEMDIQLTSDNVPIIHHDFEIITDKSESKTLSQVWTGFFEYWMKDRDENGKYKNKMIEEFKHGKRHHGLDRVFIKDYTYDTLSKLTDDTFETMGYYDINEYIDTVLDVVDAGVKGRQRNIIFVSFSPDICLALTRKQHKYPVALLTVAETEDFDPYSDYRVQSSVNVVRFARIMKLHGVSFNSEDLIHLNFKEGDAELKENEKPESIRLTKEKKGKDGNVEDPELIRIVWGEQTDGPDAFNYFVKLGMHVIVRDNSIYGPMKKDSKSSNGTDPQKNGVQHHRSQMKRLKRKKH